MSSVQSDPNRHGDVRIEDIFPGSIQDIHIGNLSADKITAGTLDASLVTISSADGQMTLAGNKLQIRNATSVIQVTLGNYTGTSYGLAIGSDPSNPDISITSTNMTINTDSFIKFIGSRCLYQNAGATLNSLVGYQVNQFTVQGDATNGVRINGGTVTVEAQDLVIDTGAATKGIQIRDGGRLTFADTGDTNTIYFKENSSSQLEAFGSSTYIWRMTRGGVITQPNQPSLNASNATERTNVTGDTTEYTIIWDATIRDRGANFDGTTFTCPVDGDYLVTAAARLKDFDALSTSAVLRIKTSNRNYEDLSTAIAVVGLQQSFALAVIADADANDTIVVTVTVNGTNKAVDVVGNGPNNIFCVSLLN